MECRHLVRIIVIFNLIDSLVCLADLKIKEESFIVNEKACQKLGKEPFFDIDLVTGKPWRIYYSWHMDLEHKCMDIKFKHVSSLMINRFYNDMKDYLAQQPTWSAAALYLSVGKGKHEMLLFDEQGPAGRFLAAPNVVKNGVVLSPNRAAVPLMKFQLKLLRGGKFLVMMDCKFGVTSLAMRSHEVNREELEGVVAELNLGDGGAFACINEDGIK